MKVSDFEKGIRSRQWSYQNVKRIVRALGSGTILFLINLKVMDPYKAILSLVKLKRFDDVKTVLSGVKGYELLECINRFESRSENKVNLDRYIKRNMKDVSSMSFIQLKAMAEFLVVTGYIKSSWVFWQLAQMSILNNDKLSSSIKKKVAFEVAAIGLESYLLNLKEYGYEGGFPASLVGCIRDLESDLRLGLLHLKEESNRFKFEQPYLEAFENSCNGVDFSGKKFLIIGPSVYDLDSDIDLASFDLVGRIAYSGADSLSTAKDLGVDVSLYKEHKISEIVAANSWEILNGLSHFIVSRASEATCTSLEGVKNVSCSSFTGDVLYPFFDLNAGQEFALNLIDSGAEVFVSNMDLFTNKIYPLGYFNPIYSDDEKVFSEKGWWLVDHLAVRMFAGAHYPVGQFAVFSYLRRHSKISGDKAFISIVDGGVSAYLEMLDEVYNPYF